MMRAIPLLIASILAGCGSPENAGAPQAEMPARTWKHYVANPGDIEPMQKICLQWSGSNGPAGKEPAVIAANCRAATFAKSMLKTQNTGSK